MNLNIKISPNFYEEKKYIISVLFRDFLGIPISIEKAGLSGSLITDGQRKWVHLADDLFAFPEDRWLRPETLPTQPLKSWNAGAVFPEANIVHHHIPVIYGKDPDNPCFCHIESGHIQLGLDVLGSSFFMLTRYEELVKPDRDEHSRFPATASLAYQEGFLDRPIVNEYLEILWACLKYLWPGLRRKPRQFQTYVSHDIDNPFEHAFCSLFALGKRCGGDLFKRRNPIHVFKRTGEWIKVKAGNGNADPLNIFDYIMDISERNNLKSAFYFIADHSTMDMDGCYNMDHPLIRGLLQKIHKRGHEIGLHASYNTYRNATQTKKELQLLKQACAQEMITQNWWGGRQHYLRCEVPTTLQNLNDAGLNYDVTLSFADVAGFRCGICYEFPIFNVVTHQNLKLRERPLVVMESTVIDESYMNLGLEDDRALQNIAKLKQRCQFFKGDFTLLWHNTRLIDEREIALYQQVLAV